MVAVAFFAGAIGALGSAIRAVEVAEDIAAIVERKSPSVGGPRR